MKPVRLLLLCATLLGLWTTVHANESAQIRGILISASNERGETDRRLASYEPTLRRILRFESYRFLGDGNTSVTVPNSGHISLGEGHELDVQAERSDGESVHLKVRWTRGGKILMSTGLVLRPGVPAVLGGPATGNKGDVYAVILTGK